MSAALSADQIRAGMAECLRALKERLSEGEAADEQLANLITTYIDDQFKNHASKIADNVDQAVRDCLEESLKKAQVDSLLQVTGVAQTAEFVTNAAAVAAVKSVPLKVVMGDNADFCFPDVANQSVGETLVLVCKEHLKLKAELAKMGEYCKNLRGFLDELVQVVSNDGGEVKVFTASEAFSRRKDIEQPVKTTPLTPEEKQGLVMCKSLAQWQVVVQRVGQARAGQLPSDWVEWLKAVSATFPFRYWIGNELQCAAPHMAYPIQPEEIRSLTHAKSEKEWKAAIDVMGCARGNRLPINWYNWLVMITQESAKWAEHPWILKELVDYDLKIATEDAKKGSSSK